VFARPHGTIKAERQNMSSVLDIYLGQGQKPEPQMLAKMCQIQTLMALSWTKGPNTSEGFMKREELITEIFLALVASNEIKNGHSKAAKQIQEHLDMHEAIQKELKPTKPAPRTPKPKFDSSKLA
jgi:hypothetical protein